MLVLDVCKFCAMIAHAMCSNGHLTQCVRVLLGNLSVCSTLVGECE